MSKDLLTKYYQNNKERLQSKTRKRYQNLSKEEKGHERYKNLPEDEK